MLLHQRWRPILGVAILLAAAPISAWSIAKEGRGEPVTKLRRLTQEQYRNTIGDIFGSDVVLQGRLENDVRVHGLLNVGASQVAVTPAGFEQYDLLARGVAAQVTGEKRRAYLIPCKPADAGKADDACARRVLTETGRLVYRRPLKADELRDYVSTARTAAQQTKSFYAGLETSLAHMLVSPQFLFRVERGLPGPDGYRLDAWSKAQRLSFLLWDGPPDPELLDAAEKGELDTAQGLALQADRMIASRQFERGTRAFFSDMLGFDNFSGLSKDGVIYPKFNVKVAQDAREQTLRLIVDQLVRQNGDYRDLLSTRKVFLTRTLGPLYDIPVQSRAGWEVAEFPQGDPRNGLLGQLAFVMLHSHPGRSSPTLRGKAIRELLLCQEVPLPPANVDFSVVQQVNSTKLPTARDRLTAHNTDPVCAGCHKVTDPLGLPLEALDAVGQLRLTENGARIDTSGQHAGVKFDDPAGLARALKQDPSLSSCLVTRAYAYGAGEPATADQAAWIGTLEKDFRQGYRYPALMKRLGTAPLFHTLPRPASTTTKVAQLRGGA